MSPPLIAQPMWMGALVFDPAAEDISWWRDYPGTPWGSTTSTGGTAGSWSFNAFNAPPGGATLNGHDIAVFDGAASSLVRNSDPVSDIIAATEFGGLLLVNPASTPTSLGDTSSLNTTLLTTTQTLLSGGGVGSLYVTIKDDGGTPTVVLVVNDGTLKAVRRPLAGLSTWSAVQIRASAGTFGIRVNGGSWDSASFSGLASVAGGLRVGVNGGIYPSVAGYFQGSLAELVLSKHAFSDPVFDGFRAYSNDRYAIAV